MTCAEIVRERRTGLATVSKGRKTGKPDQNRCFWRSVLYLFLLFSSTDWKKKGIIGKLRFRANHNIGRKVWHIWYVSETAGQKRRFVEAYRSNLRSAEPLFEVLFFSSIAMNATTKAPLGQEMEKSSHPSEMACCTDSDASHCEVWHFNSSRILRYHAKRHLFERLEREHLGPLA